MARTQRRMLALLLASAVVLPATAQHVRNCNNSKHFALTFDDGPSQYTNILLDILRDIKVNATFFVTGERIKMHPEVLARAYYEGHIIGGHTYTHLAGDEVPPKELEHEIRMTDRAVRTVIGVVPNFFRFPFGFHSATATAVVKNLGKISVLWSADTLDYELQASEPRNISLRALDGMTQAQQSGEGVILLQHDLYVRSYYQVPYIVALARDRGFEVVDLLACTGEAAAYTRVNARPWKRLLH